MQKLLESIFGKSLECYKERFVFGPAYLRQGRSFFDITISGCSFVEVLLIEHERFNIKTLKKMLPKYEQFFKSPIVYGFKHITTYQRKSLIENGIPFISKNSQIYIPFLGVYFARADKTDYVETIEKSFSPTEQMLFLLFLYGEDQYTKTEAYKAIKMSPMSISRASRRLSDLGLITEQKSGNEIIMRIKDDKMYLYRKCEPLLINPIQQISYVLNKRVYTCTPSCGEYSLSLRTDLGYPEYVEYAFYKDKFNINKEEIIDPGLNENIDLACIQLWKYDPNIFAINQMVDPVSLIQTLKDSDDERVQASLKKVEGEIWGWTITQH